MTFLKYLVPGHRPAPQNRPSDDAPAPRKALDLDRAQERRPEPKSLAVPPPALQSLKPSAETGATSRPPVTQARPPEVHALRQATPGLKFQFPTSEYLKASGMRVIHLMDAKTKACKYLMTESLADDQGAWSKIKYGYDRMGNRVAIREMRLPEGVKTATHSKALRAKTKPVPKEHAIADAQKTRDIRQSIETNLQRRIVRNQGRDPLATVRSEIKPFKVLDIIEASHKIYVVSSLESGDLFSIRANIPLSIRRDVALSISAQMLDELASMDAAGWAHLDVKDENALFSPNGQVKVMDLGDCAEIDPLTGETAVRGVYGTAPAPEMFMHDAELIKDEIFVPPHLTPATDVFAMGILGVNLLIHEPEDNGPLWWVDDANGVRDMTETRRVLNRHEDWLNKALLPNEGLNSAAFQDGSNFAKHYGKALRVAPAQTEMWLRFALCKDPTQRATLNTLKQITALMVEDMPSDRADKVKAFFAEAHKAGQQDDVFACLDNYRSWLGEHKSDRTDLSFNFDKGKTQASGL